MTSRQCWGLLLAAGGLLATAPAAAQTEIKIATVAPDGSAWMRIFNKMKASVEQKTAGAVKLRFYSGQVQGDELPGVSLKFVAGLQRLPNGNTVVCNWLGHGNLGKAPHLVGPPLWNLMYLPPAGMPLAMNAW